VEAEKTVTEAAGFKTGAEQPPLRPGGFKPAEKGIRLCPLI